MAALGKWPRQGNPWKRHASDEPFPARISRSLTLGLGIILGAVLLVGATSLTLALQIFYSIDGSAREFGQILKLNQIHSVFDDLIFELHQIDSTRQLDRTVDAVLLQEEITRQLDAVGEEVRGHSDTAGREQAVLGSLRQFSDEGRAVANRLSATGHLTRSDLEWLSVATHEVPRLTDELAGMREFRITRLHESSESLIEVMVVVFVAFTVVGGALVVVARLAAAAASPPRCTGWPTPHGGLPKAGWRRGSRSAA